jgi:hypothetical protein
MAQRLISMEEMKALVDRMCDPSLSDAQLNSVMGQAARVLGVDNRRRVANADALQRNKVATASAAGDLAALRKLANANLNRKR